MNKTINTEIITKSSNNDLINNIEEVVKKTSTDKLKLLEEKVYKYLDEKVKEKLESTGHEKWFSRYRHSCMVAKKASELAQKYFPDDRVLRLKAFIAGMLHDYAKYESIYDYENIVKKNNLDITINKDARQVYHSLLGPYIIKEELAITDIDILNAVKYHAIGKPNMSSIEALVYISDFVEESRVGEVFVKARDLVNVSLEQTIAYISKTVMLDLINRNRYILIYSIDTYNYYYKYNETEVN